MRRENKEKGFTLIEVLVALVILTVGILAVQMMQVHSIEENTSAGGISAKSMMAATQIETILNLAYNDPALVDFDRDGTDQDRDFDGIDDDDDGNFSFTNINEEFGLRHRRCCPGNVDPRGNAVAAGICNGEVADQCDFFQGYDIYWNIAVDHPVENTKTINIIVINSADQAAQTTEMVNRAEDTYIKVDII